MPSAKYEKDHYRVRVVSRHLETPSENLLAGIIRTLGTPDVLLVSGSVEIRFSATQSGSVPVQSVLLLLTPRCGVDTDEATTAGKEYFYVFYGLQRPRIRRETPLLDTCHKNVLVEGDILQHDAYVLCLRNRV